MGVARRAGLPELGVDDSPGVAGCAHLAGPGRVMSSQGLSSQGRTKRSKYSSL